MLEYCFLSTENSNRWSLLLAEILATELIGSEQAETIPAWVRGHGFLWSVSISGCPGIHFPCLDLYLLTSLFPLFQEECLIISWNGQFCCPWKTTSSDPGLHYNLNFICVSTFFWCCNSQNCVMGIGKVRIEFTWKFFEGRKDVFFLFISLIWQSQRHGNYQRMFNWTEWV